MPEPTAAPREDQEPALARLAGPPRRRCSPVLALLALSVGLDPARPTTSDGRAEETAPPLVPAPRGAEEDPAPAAAAAPHPGPPADARVPVLDRVWARDPATMRRVLAGLRAL